MTEEQRAAQVERINARKPGEAFEYVFGIAAVPGISVSQVKPVVYLTLNNLENCVNERAASSYV